MKLNYKGMVKHAEDLSLTDYLLYLISVYYMLFADHFHSK